MGKIKLMTESNASSAFEITLVEERLLEFESRADVRETWGGRNTHQFFQGVIDPDSHSEFVAALEQQVPAGRLRRKDVCDLVADAKVDTLSVCLAIMAWGHMRPGHARAFFERRANWIGLASELRWSEMDRVTAYDRFARLRAADKLGHVGPAYFTKLIFFLTFASKKGRKPGLIMDQWTARSANFLAEKPFIKLTGLGESQWVDDRNTASNYECFCRLIEAIAARNGNDPAVVEMCMFSEGRGRGRWRNYLKNVTRLRA